MYRYLIYIGIFFAGVVIDAAAKSYVNRKNDDPVYFLFFELRKVYNHGAAFGMLHNRKKLLYILITVAFFLGILLFFIEKDHFFRLMLAVMLSGAAGNFYDRIRHGRVTDFIRIRFGRLPYVNIADILLFVPAIIIIIKYVFVGAYD